MRHLSVSVVALVIGALTVLALAGNSRLDGPVLWAVTDRHGLHRGDLAIVAVASVGLLTLAALHRSVRRRSAPRTGPGRGRVAQRAPR